MNQFVLEGVKIEKVTNTATESEWDKIVFTL
jgi:hypothetical protein